MRGKLGIILLGWIVLVAGNERTKRDNDVTDDQGSGGNGIVTSQTNMDQNSTVQNLDDDWFPRLNVTCKLNKLELTRNPGCVGGKLNQTWKSCPEGIFESSAETTRGCVTSQRLIECAGDQVRSDWTASKTLTNCCKSDTCEFEGVTYKRQECVFDISSKDIDDGCTVERRADECVCGRAAPSDPGDVNWESEDGDGGEGNGVSIRTIAISMAGTVMVGLLLFAAIRIRKAAMHRRNQPPFDREIQGVDNEAIGSLPADSRIQTILNTINANGRNYELRERSDSVPGRRVYVLSPTPSQDSNSVGSGRGRGFSRTLSQLSSIAEESTEGDALSYITEATEPAESDCVFRYDRDAINEVDRISSKSSECAFEEENPRPASSSEVINSLNDVIAMYEADSDVDNDNIEEIIKENSRLSVPDFRISTSTDDTDYLKDFGWKPQDRDWKIEKLKDQSSKSKEKLSASCSTLDSRYSENSIASSASLGNDYIMSNGVATDDENSLEPLLGNGNVTSSNLKDAKRHRSMPSVLDTSQIPDIDDVLAEELKGLNGDVMVNGDVYA